VTNTATETRSVVVERNFPHSPEKLWRALTQPHLIEEWLMKNDFKLEVGHSFNMRGDWGGVLDCEVLTVEPNRELSYAWDFKHDAYAFWRRHSPAHGTVGLSAASEAGFRRRSCRLEAVSRQAGSCAHAGRVRSASSTSN
jgi:uncharacterized protein YndB with AHSA1/START domain